LGMIPENRNTPVSMRNGTRPGPMRGSKPA